MAVSRAQRRLLRVRALEEEQARQALQSGLADLGRLEQLRTAAEQRERRGRHLFIAGAHSNHLQDRLAGVAETDAGCRQALAIGPWLADAEQDVAALRVEFLARRVERRQAQTLVEEAEAAMARDRDRRSQQELDDWYRNGLQRNRKKP